MTVSPPSPQNASALPGGSKKSLGRKVFDFAVRVLTPLFWLYATLKLYVFDVDTFLVERLAPSLRALLAYKIVIVLVFAIICMFTMRKRLFWLTAGYVVFYPLIVVFWYIPFLIFKRRSWNLAFSYVNAVVAFVQDFRHNVISFSIFTLLSIGGMMLSDRYSLTIVSLSFVILLIWIYFQSLLSVFRPPRVFEAYAKFFPAWRRTVPKTFELEPAWKGISAAQLAPTDRKQWYSRLQSSVMYNRGCLYIANKLSQYQKTRYNYISYAFSFVLLACGTIFAFSVIDWGIYRIDPVQYTGISKPTYFDFLYYSFVSFTHGSFQLAASGLIARLSYVLQIVFEVLLGGLIVALGFSVRSTKYDSEIASTVENLKRQSETMEEFIRSEYGVPSISDAVNVLRSDDESSVAFIVLLSR